MENKHQPWDLAQMQALPLSAKIRMTQDRIKGWYEYWGGNVYVSVSGGKDSQVLAHIVKDMYPDVPCVFVNTGLEYDSVRRKGIELSDEVLRPEMQFVEVIKKYGYPIISKEVAECVEGAKKYLTKILEENSTLTDRQTDRQTDHLTHIGTIDLQDKESTVNFPLPSLVQKRNQCKILLGGGTTTNLENFEDLASMPQRLAIMMGKYNQWRAARENIPSYGHGDRTRFSQVKYKFLLYSPFRISNKCCNMKKNPTHKYSKKTDRKPFIGTMASESRLRKQMWIRYGCNAFDKKGYPSSQPLSFWTEQDILQYIKQNNLEIAEVYGDVVYVDSDGYEYNNPLFIDDMDLTLTGVKRTGCVFCMFGITQDTDRFLKLKEVEPKKYNFVMNGGEFDDNGMWIPNKQGLGYKFVIDWLNEHGNLGIKY